jgi:hypothetical protein
MDQLRGMIGPLGRPLLLLALGVLLGAPSLTGQAPEGPLATDTLAASPPDSLPAPHRNDFQAAAYALMFAPSAILLLIEAETGPLRLGFPRRHASVAVHGGRRFTPDDASVRAGWSGAATMEVLLSGWLGEARAERAAAAGDRDHVAVRVGRLWQHGSSSAGGILVGYRRLGGTGGEGAVEIALPFVSGGPHSWVRAEVAYALSPDRASWNHRVRGERVMGNGPFVVGLEGALTSWRLDRGGDPYATLSFVVGAMLR